MKVLVTGVSGQLGFDVMRELLARGIEAKGASRSDFSLTDFAAMRRFVEAHRPTAIIHCAAYTAVDKAEDEPELCREVNAAATGELAHLAKEIGAKFLYISTDYVFPGTGEDFYEPEDKKAPCNVYGESKLLGEEAAQKEIDELFIVRISWVFGENGKNFIKTMLRLAETHEELSVVGDQIGAPTDTRDLAPARRYDCDAKVRRLPCDERRHMLVGGTCRRISSLRGEEDAREGDQDGGVSNEGEAAQEFAPVEEMSR